jgi:DNA replication protein DnaC
VPGRSPEPDHHAVGHVFGDETIAAAVLDRVLHHSHVLIIQGDSFRLRQKKRAGLLGSSKTSH